MLLAAALLLLTACPVEDPSTSVPEGWFYDSECGDSGDAPLWFFLFGHHYGGPGGFYPTTEMYLEMLDALEDMGVADQSHFFFDGISVDLLQQEDPMGLLRGRLLTAGVGFGYHGEEIHGPGPTILDMTQGIGWQETEDLIASRYTTQITYALDPVSRLIDPDYGDDLLSGASGGVQLVKDYFGTTLDVMPNHGMPSPPTGLSLRAINDFPFFQGANFLAWHWYRDQGLPSEYGDPAWNYFGRDIYLLWHMGRLTFKNPEETYWMSLEGPKRTRQLLRTLPRCRPSFTKILIEEPVADMGAAIQVALDWIADHPNSAFVTRKLLEEKVGPATGTLDAATLETGARYLILEWDGGPPDGMRVGEDAWWSLADGLEALAKAVAVTRDGGNLPDSVEVTGIYGPRGEPEEQIYHPGSTSLVTLRRSDVAAAADAVVQVLAAEKEPFLPLVFRVGDQDINVAEFLLALAQTYVMARDGSAAETVTVSSRRMWPAIGEGEAAAFQALSATEPLPLFYDQMQMWTVKPARIDW